MPTPVPPPWKVQLFFNCTTGARAAGWSEIYWHLGVDQNAVIAQIFTAGTGLADVRLALLPPEVSLVYARVSDPTNPRRVATFDLLGTPSPGTFDDPGLPQGTSEESLHPDLAILVRQTTDDFRRVNRWLHGVPFEMYLPPYSLQTSAVLDSAQNAYET